MTLEDNEELQALSDKEIKELFDRFSFPILRPCITSHQKKSAVGIAKILWLRLVTGTDSETNIYRDLKGILGDKHDANVGVGSLYFFKMKATLIEAEIRRLRSHFSNVANFNRLKEWVRGVGPDELGRGRTSRSSRRRSR